MSDGRKVCIKIWCGYIEAPAHLTVAAVVAFCQGGKTSRRLRWNPKYRRLELV